MVVDTHLHPLSSDRLTYPPDPRSRPGAAAKAPNEAEAILRHLDAAGVSKAVLVQFVSVYGYDNSFCADCAALAPDRLVSVCSVDPLSEDAANQLSYWVEGRGMRGLRLFIPAGWTEPIDGWPDVAPVWALMSRAQALALPVSVQCGSHHLPALGMLAARYPDVRLVVDHLAGLDASLPASSSGVVELLELAGLSNVQLKFSTTNLPTTPGSRGSDAFRVLLDRYGEDRVMWGSNYPASSDAQGSYGGLLPDAVRFLQDIVSQEESSFILGKNAETLYGL